MKVNNQFYIVGRDDRMAAHMAGKTRIELSELLKDIDRNLPIILLDHQPVSLGEGQQNGVDLQLSDIRTLDSFPQHFNFQACV